MITRIKNTVGTHKKRSLIIAIVVIILLFVAFSGGEPVEEINELKNEFPQVSLKAVNELAREGNIALIGTVESVDEARLEAETSGRITSVSVAIGDTVRAGQTIAQIENADEYAALLQAEGSYEAALASNTGTTIDAVSTYKDVYITLDSIVRNTVDDQFSRPTTQYPGFRLDGLGRAPELGQERVAIENILDTLAGVQNTVTAANVGQELQGLRTDTVRIANFVEEIAYIVSRQDVTSSFTQTTKDTTEAAFLSARNALAGAIQDIDTALNDIAVSESGTSSNDAAVKQALGRLKAAQAAYNKTVITTPIAGTVNRVAVQAGDFVNTFDSIADIANNNALKITAYINANERDRVAVGTPVVINKDLEGSVSRVAPAIDPATGKVEVQIQIESEELTNGDSVSLSINPEIEISESEPLDVLRVPLPAIKLTTTTAYVFTIEDERLVAHEVELGDIQSDTVEIVSGINPDWNIVLDARGLADGQRVRITE
ncbi:HlyD family efflux transporter periplasmic adaptor subunit [Candidatus Kaiserbacteria bacterium]|nr:HlyD family efflux transporter periplasmic adaptor subunit [Candidatus Kaiserbacteria bacterium]